jgi:hypothetical protein
VWRIKRERGCNSNSPLIVSLKVERVFPLKGGACFAVALAEAEQGVLANTFVIPVPAYARINSGGNPVK